MQQDGIAWGKYREAYSKIIPLVFPKAKAGDIIAPVLAFHDEEHGFEYDATINISQDRDRDFWEEALEKAIQSQKRNKTDENELY